MQSEREGEKNKEHPRPFKGSFAELLIAELYYLGIPAGIWYLATQATNFEFLTNYF